MVTRLGLLAASLAFLLGAASCRAPGLEDTTFTSLGQGSVSESAALGQQPHLVLFRSRAAWGRERGFYPLDLSAGAERALEAVDFSTQSLAALTLGGRPTGGFGIELKLLVAGPPPQFVLASRRPGPGEMVIQITTHPFHLVIVNAIAIPADAVFELDGVATAFARVIEE